MEQKPIQVEVKETAKQNGKFQEMVCCDLDADNFIVLGEGCPAWDSNMLSQLGGTLKSVQGFMFQKSKHSKAHILSSLMPIGNDAHDAPLIDVGENETKKESIQISPTLYLAMYSEKSVAVFGETKSMKDNLRGLKGIFNSSLQDPKNGTPTPGWVFPVNQKDLILSQLREYALSGVFPPLPEVIIDPTIPKTVLANGLYMVDYTEKSVAVFGDTKSVKDVLKKLCGRFNPVLKDPTRGGMTAPGWIFQKTSRQAAIAALGGKDVAKKIGKDNIKAKSDAKMRPKKRARLEEEENAESSDEDEEEDEWTDDDFEVAA